MPTDTSLPALLPVLMGAVAVIALHHLVLWAGRPADRLPLWVTAWCGATLLFLGGHHVQLAADTPRRVVQGGRVAWLGGLAIVVVICGLLHALTGRAAMRRALWPLAGLSAGLGALVLFTDLLVTGATYVRTDLLGTRYRAPVPGPFLPVIGVYILGALLYAWWAGLRPPGALEPAERRAIVAGFVVYVAAGLNDALHSAQVIQSVRVFDPAFVAMALGLSFLLARRYNRLQAHLEDEVATRTGELAKALEATRAASAEARRGQAVLAGLVRAGRNLMSGLDLTGTLEQIIAETRNITGSPHIKVLLVDREAGVLRMGASSGGTVPPDFQVPLGTSYSGTVAATGQPLFVADTQTDPRNLLAQRDRDEGIRTYLGLPIRKGGEVLGVLTINTEAPHTYTPEELDTLGSFADQAALAIDNARLYAAASERERRLGALAAITRELTATLRLDEVLERFVRHAAGLFASSVARLWLLEEDGQTLALRAEAGATGAVPGVTRMRVGEGIMGRVAATRAPVVIDDLEGYAGRLNAARQQAEGLRSAAAVPVLLGDRLLGALSIAARDRRRFSADQVELLQTLAAHAAIAIENARLFHEAATRGRRLTALAGVSRRLSAELELRTVLDAIVAAAAEVFEGEAGIRILEGEELVRVAATPRARDAMYRERIRLGESISGRVAASGEPYLTSDTAGDPHLIAEHRSRQLEQTSSIMCLPVRRGGRILGTLHVLAVRGHRFDQAELALAMQLADQAAIAIENARLYEAVEARVRRLETLTRLTHMISSSLDRDRVLGEIARAAAELSRSAAAAFWLADETSRTLDLIAASDAAVHDDFPRRRLAFGEGLIGWVAAHRQRLLVPDVAADPRSIATGWARAHGVQTFSGVPVVAEGALIGVLTLHGRQSLRLEADEEQLLQSFVAQAAVAVRNASLYEAEGRARREAEHALSQVKQLHGLLPICAYCKRVRNDRNYWEQIESYIGERSQATFSHGICPDCRSTVVARELERWRQEGR
jgi:GAF domain-containing protein